MLSTRWGEICRRATNYYFNKTVSYSRHEECYVVVVTLSFSKGRSVGIKRRTHKVFTKLRQTTKKQQVYFCLYLTLFHYFQIKLAVYYGDRYRRKRHLQLLSDLQ